jgi:hypothetical protein
MYFIANVAYPHAALLSLQVDTFRESWKRGFTETPGSTDAEKKLNASIQRPNQSISSTNSEIRLFLNSCPDIYIKVGSFYNFTKTTPTTFSRIIVDNAINLLLAF